MKGKQLLVCATFMSALSAWAVSSPYQGSVAATGSFYLYQVETGKWLEPNHKNFDQWTTHAELDTQGMDVELRKPEGYAGFSIFCNFTNNGSLNGADQDRFYLDQPNRDLTDWIFEPVTVDGVVNAYRISAKATPEGTGERSAIAADIYIGASDGELSDAPQDFTWQLVTREERLRVMQEQVKEGPVDVSWLLPGFDLGRNDFRRDKWLHNIDNTRGGNTAFDGARGYPVQEYWHQCTVTKSIKIEGLPTGTYEFAIQAYYRDTEIESQDLQQRFLDGTENLRAEYFAGATRGTVMSIFANAKDEQTDGYSYFAEKAGKWVPNSVGDACRAMFDGAYINPYIQAGVTDGTLTVGYEKNTYDHRDWLICKRVYLRYVSTDPIAEDLTPLRNQLSELIDKAKGLPQVAILQTAIADAATALETASSSTALLEAYAALDEIYVVVNQSKDLINTYNEVIALSDAAGVNNDKAKTVFAEAKTRDNFNRALYLARVGRLRAAAVTHPDVFPGQPATTGEFYLYNVGQKQFLTGGSDWGAHAALGLPGTLITLEATEDEAAAGTFHVNTGLYNGAEKHYMDYRGYMDCAMAGQWLFKAVEGKENVYNIFQADYPDVHVAWNPETGVNDGHGDETSVCTESRNLQVDDLDAQWKLVTAAERDALIETASLDNPVDLTHRIGNPGFNQRADESVWSFTNAVIWERGANHNDFAAESWNTASAEISQNILNMPAGVYAVYVNGFYRNGHHKTETETRDDQEVEILGQPDTDIVSYAFLQAGNEPEDDVELPNIASISGKAPGQGAEVTSKEGAKFYYPQYVDQACEWFRLGLYSVHTVINLETAGDLFIAVAKAEGEYLEKDWVVADNFRIFYYGTETTKDAVKSKIDETTGVEDIDAITTQRPADNRIFNIQGIEVERATAPGLYIRNGKKFIVR